MDEWITVVVDGASLKGIALREVSKTVEEGGNFGPNGGPHLLTLASVDDSKVYFFSMSSTVEAPTMGEEMTIGKIGKSNFVLCEGTMNNLSELEKIGIIPADKKEALGKALYSVGQAKKYL